MSQGFEARTHFRTLHAQAIIAPDDPGNFKIASPVVWQTQKDGLRRLCACFQTQVNDKIMIGSYPHTDMETIIHELLSSMFHGKIDLSSVDYQTTLDDSGQNISVIKTTTGSFKLLRLPQGTKNASRKLQRTMDNSLKDLVGKVCFQNEVLLHGRTRSYCEKRWRAVEDRMKDKDFTFNKIKSGNIIEKITNLSFTIPGSSIEPNDLLVKQISKVQSIQSVKAVESFCGLVNFYCWFITIFTPIF